MTNILDWVAVDWGTSNMRAWGIAPDGEVIFAKSSPKGMGTLSRNDYYSALLELLPDAGEQSSRSIDVVICGMAGARQGWIEAPYLEAPSDLARLLDHSVNPLVPDDRLSVAILPGVCQRIGSENVMRGEETQLLGFAELNPGFEGVVCLPGTHSKWAHLKGTRLEKFSTAMTGELFDVLRRHSVLRHSVREPTPDAEQDEGFKAGAQIGLEAPETLLSSLFNVRAASLLSGRNPGWSTGYLSGLLIGTDVGSMRRQLNGSPVPLIGAHLLCSRYAEVLAMLGVKATLGNAKDTVISGLKAARLRASKDTK